MLDEGICKWMDELMSFFHPSASKTITKTVKTIRFFELASLAIDLVSRFESCLVRFFVSDIEGFEIVKALYRDIMVLPYYQYRWKL